MSSKFIILSKDFIKKTKNLYVVKLAWSKSIVINSFEGGLMNQFWVVGHSWLVMCGRSC